MSFATQLPSISARFSPTCSSCCGKWVFSRNVKQVDPSRPVPYRSGLVFERFTAGQVRAGCGPKNG
ncbi:hypothetical protein DY000_02053281 [Brassica cretica]|uniref:Uncharacterized protein n=1 Tax=Brassica cretica TaxID=69181 RepID=A0ABQ7AG21_BRACR|nr:hypothetical protein DY000_02053281 [Brassica cretica]